MLKIIFSDNTYYVEITPDVMLAELVARAGIMLDLRCGGFGVCGRCKVELLSGEFVINGKTKKVTSRPMSALACRTSLNGTDAEISVPQNSVVHADGKIAVDYEHVPKPQSPGFCLFKIIPPCEFTVDGMRSLAEIPDAGDLYWPPETLRLLGKCCHDDTTIHVAVVNRQNRPGWAAAALPQPFDPLGVAIDVGTTTVAMALLDLKNDEPLASASAYNRQANRGDNVATRISYSSGSPENLAELRRLIINDTINPLLARLFAETKRNPNEVIKVSVSGNTVMSHLLLGISPRSIGVMPFLPTLRVYPEITAGEAGVAVNPGALLDVLPAVSGYIGGDIVAGIMASGMMSSENRHSLLIDIGTNCEIVLFSEQKLYACAAAAGPAFEGAGIACGSRAAAGAIDSIKISSELALSFTTIEDAPPVGLCGSAIIDFVAAGFTSGLLDTYGRFNLERLRQCGRYYEVDYGNGIIHTCMIATGGGGKPIYVSEADIEQVLKAKAAVYAGVKSLIATCQRKFDELEKVYLAGGFARYLSIQNAITLGMLPPLPSERFHKIGNGALAGAVISLFDPESTAVARHLIDQPEIIELNILPEFENDYIDALLIPNFKPEEFQ